MRSLTKGTGSGINKKFLFMLFIILLEFAVSYLPFVLVNMVKISSILSFKLNLYYFQYDFCHKRPFLHVLAYVINWTSVVVNPVIYVVMQTMYQVCLRPLFSKVLSCML